MVFRVYRGESGGKVSYIVLPLLTLPFQAQIDIGITVWIVVELH
jgi:hypothetical protein